MKADYGKVMHAYSTDLLPRADPACSVPTEAEGSCSSYFYSGISFNHFCYRIIIFTVRYYTTLKGFYVPLWIAYVYTHKTFSSNNSPDSHWKKTMPPDLHGSHPKLQFLGLLSHILLDLHPGNHYSSNPTLLRPQASFHQHSFKCITCPESWWMSAVWEGGTAAQGRDWVTRAEQVRCFHSSQLWHKLIGGLLGSLVWGLYKS